MIFMSCLIAAFLVASSLMLVLRPVAIAIGMVDRPGGRKVHRGEIPIVGGIAMLAGLVVAAVAGEHLGHHGTAMIATAAFMVLLGAVDDRFGLPPGVRLIAHSAAAAALVYGSGFQVGTLGNLFGTGDCA